MMYIKKFETYSTYNIGDYVLIKNSRIEMLRFNSSGKIDIFKYAKIVDINDKKNYTIETIIPDYFSTPDKRKEIKKIRLDDHFDSFERKLTYKEIEEFELKKDEIKYNL